MIKKITSKDEPSLFVDLLEFSIEANKEHRRGSNFYRYDIIEFEESHSKWFPAIEDFSKYVGFWKTNDFIWDSEYGTDDKPYELTRMVKYDETITITKYKVHG